MVYLTTLEGTRARVGALLRSQPGLSDPFVAGASSFLAGFSASLVTQAITVPVDVVSQRLMVQDRVKVGLEVIGGPKYTSALQTLRLIVEKEGVRGLYRGLPISLVTYAPSSAIWWSSYSTYRELFSSLLLVAGPAQAAAATATASLDVAAPRPAGSPVAASPSTSAVESASGVGEVLVQVLSGVLSGGTTAMLTNPLDMIKTRMQVRDIAKGTAPPTVRGVFLEILRQYGVWGFFRGVAPRMASSALWGTSMVSVYEFLKRSCKKEP